MNRCVLKWLADQSGRRSVGVRAAAVRQLVGDGCRPGARAVAPGSGPAGAVLLRSGRAAVTRLRLGSERARGRAAVLLAASWFTKLTVQSECDQVDFDLLVKNKILEADEQQTGWDRLVAMYTVDEMGGLTPELELVSSIGVAGLLFGGALGAALNGRLAIVKFVERNQATAFETPLTAKKALQDRVMLGMARGFFMFGWRTALFTSVFGLVSTTLMVYTNEISAFHYACAGAVAGTLYKVSMGLRGMTAGAVAGGLLGLFGGSILSLVCVVTGTTLPKLRYQQYLWKYQQEMRDKARAERRRQQRQTKAEKKLEEQQTAEQREGAGSGRAALRSAAGAAEDAADRTERRPDRKAEAEAAAGDTQGDRTEGRPDRKAGDTQCSPPVAGPAHAESPGTAASPT